MSRTLRSDDEGFVWISSRALVDVGEDSMGEEPDVRNWRR